MNLNEVRPPKGATKNKKRKGRGPGSGNGTTAGKGSNGQNARSGRSVRPGFEGGQMPLTRSLPKRGFTNHFRVEYQVVNVKDVDKKATGQGVMDPEQMFKLGLISSKNKKVKILGEGGISVPVTVQAHSFSASAKEKIEKANGKAEVLAK